MRREDLGIFRPKRERYLFRVEMVSAALVFAQSLNSLHQLIADDTTFARYAEEHPLSWDEVIVLLQHLGASKIELVLSLSTMIGLCVSVFIEAHKKISL